MSWPVLAPEPGGPASRGAWMVGAAYVAAFLVLDWVSYIRPFQGLNITPWNPQPALAIALLLANPRWLWLVWLSLLTADLAVRGMPSDWFVALVATAALGLSYAGIARALQQRLGPAPALEGRRDLGWFTLTVVGGALVSGTVYVSTLIAGGVGPQVHIVEAIARYWIGDAVGMIVLLPTLLMLLRPAGRASLASALRHPECWLVGAVVVVLVVAVFGRADRDHFRFFYVLFLPVVWASVRLGLTGAVLAAGLTQVGLIVAVQSTTNADLTVFELQVLMAAVTMTGLALGVVVDERERAAAELKGSLRLAAAGQMAAALAHELIQPLTALNSYAQATRLLAASDQVPESERLPRLVEVSGRMADDALRAGEVVKRLRDFFRTGSTQLRPTDLAAAVAQAVSQCARRAEALGVQIEHDVPSGLPRVLMDDVQIAVVLRNLLANALDAASLAPSAGPRSVRVRVRESRGTLHVQVLDSGPGVPASRLATLFEPGPSDKAGGMGVGLSICRAIIEAHGGQLWAEPGAAGHFVFSLPVAEAGVATHAP